MVKYNNNNKVLRIIVSYYHYGFCADWPKFDTSDNRKRRKFRGISKVCTANLILGSCSLNSRDRSLGPSVLVSLSQ